MKRLLGFCVAISASASPAIAAPGDQWILGIHHLDQSAGFTENAGAGFKGGQSSGGSEFHGNSYSHSGSAGDISRVYWELSGPAINGPWDYNHDGRVDAADYVTWRKNPAEFGGVSGYNNWQENFGTVGNSVPTTTELYTIEYYGVPQPGGRNDYQVIESRFHGEGHPEHGGEAFPYDDHIPWVGQFGTNHQWIKTADTHAVGQWLATGPFGPQAPDSNDFNASGFGPFMWLTSRSWLYVKWDQPFATARAWSALRLTQVTENGQFLDGTGAVGTGGVPEPAGIILLLIGVIGTTLSRRRAGDKLCSSSSCTSDLHQ